MGIGQVDEWAQERLRLANGGWCKDVVSTLLICMENRGPIYVRYIDEAKAVEFLEEYQRYIELGLEFAQTLDVNDRGAILKEFYDRVQEDVAWFLRHSDKEHQCYEAVREQYRALLPLLAMVK